MHKKCNKLFVLDYVYFLLLTTGALSVKTTLIKQSIKMKVHFSL